MSVYLGVSVGIVCIESQMGCRDQLSYFRADCQYFKRLVTVEDRLQHYTEWGERTFLLSTWIQKVVKGGGFKFQVQG